MADERVPREPEEGAKAEAGRGDGPRNEGLRHRLKGAAKRFMDDPGAREVLGSLLDSSDKAKTEMVRAVGREVRTYLEGLGLPDLLHKLATGYSLEVKASVSLKPLAAAGEPGDGKG